MIGEREMHCCRNYQLTRSLNMQSYERVNNLPRGQNSFSRRKGNTQSEGLWRPTLRTEISSTAIKERVDGNLKWMGRKFKGTNLRKLYRGRWYKGLVQRVGWNRTKGYGATVVYEDGYVEIVPVATLVTLHQRKEYSDAQKLRERVESSSENQCQGAKVDSGRNAGKSVTAQEESTNIERDQQLEPLQQRKLIRDQEGLLHERFVGSCILKYFVSADGVGREFLGTVQCVWWCNNQRFYARIKYDDGDEEDITVEEVELC